MSRIIASTAQILLILLAFATAAQAQTAPFQIEDRWFRLTPLRTGTYYESGIGPFKGCVLYLEGFGDSILNHQPLFHALSESGYRVITFDYYGQGGSAGSMNSTRLMSIIPGFTIGSQARWMWNRAVRTPDPRFGRTCAQSPKIVMGWSTGGLAAYKLAYEKWADVVILIAPGIHVKTYVGESAEHANLKNVFNSVTERTLTSQKYGPGVPNPHLEPPRPNSPFDTPLFALNLLATSSRAQGWKIDPSVKGLVFLSGPKDTYVDSAAVAKTLRTNARHFRLVHAPNALHEIDNEVPAIARGLQTRVVDYLDSILIPTMIGQR